MKALSNFTVDGVSIPVTIIGFTLSTGPATSPTGQVLGFAYTNLGTTGDDVQLTYTIGQAGLSAVTLTELLCPVPAGVAVSCSGASNAASSPSVTLAGTNYAFEPVSTAPAPEPVTFSLMGLGLTALGFAGRKRLRKQ